MLKQRIFLYSSLGLFLICLGEKATSEELRPSAKGAVVSVLDKTFGKTHQIEIPVGESKVDDTLRIIVHRCEVQKEIAPLETKAFLEIWEQKSGLSPKMIFSGWLFSQNPAASTLDHPQYDVWVDACY